MIDEVQSLAPQQRRILALWRAHGGGTLVARGWMLLPGETEPGQLAAALGRLVSRFDILRTRHLLLPGAQHGRQIAPASDRLEPRDLGSIEEPPWCWDVAGDAGSPLAAVVATRADGRRWLLLLAGAMNADPTSLELLLACLADELARGTAVAGGDSGDSAAFRFEDLVSWLSEAGEGDAALEAHTYWRSQLAQLHLGSRLPFQHLPQGGLKIQRLALSGGGSWEQELGAKADALGVCPAALLLCCWLTLLQRRLDLPELLVGVARDGRDFEELRRVVGPLTRLMPLRLGVAPGASLGRASAELEARLREAAGWQQALSWEELGNGGSGPDSTFRLPLGFDVPWGPAAAGLRAPAWGSNDGAEACLLVLAQRSEEGGPALELRYDAASIEEMEVAALGRQLLTLLRSALADPAGELSRLETLSAEERGVLLFEFNTNEHRFDGPHTLVERIRGQVAKSPEAIAVSFRERAVSYQELALWARSLAGQLRARGVGADVPVGVLLERSEALLVALVAVLEAGGAYVPLDPAYPVERLRFMMKDFAGDRPPLVIGAPELLARFSRELELDAVVLQDHNRAATTAATAPPLPENLAYVIYTSGSTGKPKGAANSHRAITNRLLWMQQAFALGPRERVLQKTPASFDVSVWEFFWPLFVGAELVMAEPGGHLDPGYLVAEIRRRGVSTLHFVPSMLRAFLDEPEAASLPSLRRVMASGEALPFDLVRAFLPLRPAELHNLYGPTEAAVDVTHHACDPAGPGPLVPIGKPIANLYLRVLSPARELLPIGVPGELYLGGVGLARGYYRRPRLTAERFVPDPCGAVRGARLYRTGDRARWLAGGEVEYLGRLDFQVKLRGFRIELGEIEAVLKEHPEVRAVVVTLHEVAADQRLVAYVASAAAAVALTPELKALCLARLPEHMVPAHFEVLAELPLSPNGKLDRKALPTPRLRPAESAATRRELTTVEELIAGIWGELLGVAAIGANDRFFDLGGHSLLAARVRTRLREALGVELSLGEVMAQPTLASLAALVEVTRLQEQLGAAPPLGAVERRGPLPLSFAQEGLWVRCQLDPGNATFHMPSALQLLGDIEVRSLALSLERLVERHESLRTAFVVQDGRGMQQALARLRLSLPVVDTAALAAAQRAERARRLARLQAAQPFTLESPPLFRVALLRLAAEEHVLLLTLHHLISDGWSMAVLHADWLELYDAHRERRQPVLRSLPIQYADYAVWQRGWLQGPALASHMEHWKQVLANAPAWIDMPSQRPRPRIESDAGGRVGRSLSPEVVVALRRLSREQDVTTYMVLAAGWAALLASYCGESDLVIGTDSANRDRLEIEGLIGFFVNQLALRFNLGGDPTFAELLVRSRRTILDAFRFQHLPFDNLVAELNTERSTAFLPLFQVKLTYQKQMGLSSGSQEAKSSAGPQLGDLSVDYVPAQLDLLLSVIEQGEQILLAVEFRRDLFDAWFAEELLAELAALLERAVADPSARLATLAPVRERWPRLDERDLGSVFFTFRRRNPEPFAPRELKLALAAGSQAVLDEVMAQGAGQSTAEGLLFAAWAAFLWRMSGERRLVVAIPASGAGPWLPVAFELEPRASLARHAVQATTLLESCRRLEGRYSWQRLELPPGEPFLPYGFSLCEAESALRPGRFDWLLSLRRQGHGVSLALGFDSGAFAAGDAERLAHNLGAFLERCLLAPDAPLAEHSPLAEAERGRVLEVFNNSGRLGPEPWLLHGMVERQVERVAERVALIAADSRLSYGEMWRRAGQLAIDLEGRGAGAEIPVALLLERSDELIVAMLAVLRAGSAYVPLDPQYPADRLSFVLSDTAAPLVLSRRHLLAKLPSPATTVLLLDEHDWSRGSSPAAAPRRLGPESTDTLAYILYTSGSTGRPKGVMVSHRQVVWSTGARLCTYGEESPGFLLLSSHAFDSSVAGIFGTLAGGAALHLPAEHAQTDPSLLARHIAEERIEALLALPSLYALVLEEGNAWDLSSLRVVIVAGEACLPELVQRHRLRLPKTSMYNEYGATETAVWGSVADCLEIEAEATVPVGEPIPGARMYVLDPEIRLLPVGAPGEVCFGGQAVARGYLRRPALTAARFCPDPLASEPGARLYRTGDLGTFTDAGQVLFLGRTDHQVKIRGYRIEVGEVEAALSGAPAVHEAVVVARDDGGGLRLVAYVVASAGAALGLDELRGFLEARLPTFMVPAIFVSLASLPRSPNGKVDRRALPAPGAGRLRSNAQRVAPAGTVETALAEVWGDVLGISDIGAHDRFFDLGGDSILAIQVASRLQTRGIHLSPRQLFEHQTIAELAPRLTFGAKAESLRVTEAEPLVGEQPLSPIQRWFFELELEEPHHWNQSVLLEVPADLAAGPLARGFAAVLSHHDALRLRFAPGLGGWRQSYAAPGQKAPLGWIDLAALARGEQRRCLSSSASAAQGSLKLGSGPITRMVVYRSNADQRGRLLWIVHHLAVDGVSWRLLLEDLASAYQQAKTEEAIELPPKTTSFAAWARELERVAPTLASEAETWLQQPWSEVRSLPSEGASSEDGVGRRVETLLQVEASLSVEETTALLRRATKEYRARIQELLLAAVGRVLARWSDGDTVLLELEGHGRELLAASLDVSRTVGWFTASFPLAFEVEVMSPPEHTLRRVKSVLRALPASGAHFGLLRSLDSEVGARLKGLPSCEVSFNYLGQFDRTLSADGPFRFAGESRGPDQSQRNRRTHRLGINAFIAGGRLRFDWGCSTELGPREAIAARAEELIAELRLLVERCSVGSVAAAALTSDDFPLAVLEAEDLSPLAAAVLHTAGSMAEVEDIYRLSPLQGSFLAHTLSAPGSEVGIEQVSCELAGELDLALFRDSWQRLVDRHPIFRTAFLADGLERPVQCVLERASISYQEEDWRALKPNQFEGRLESFLAADRRRGFVLTAPPLMRVAVLRLASGRFHFVWTFHHLLLDAWCTSLVLREVLTTYRALTRGESPTLPESPGFKTYIAWLARQDRAAAAAFWQRHLEGAPPCPTPLAVDRVGDATESGFGVRTMVLPETEADGLAALARRCSATLNTLVGAAWALLLARYSGRDDVVFGAAVSGRPGELAQVETIMGMFINNLPVRLRVPWEASCLAWLPEVQQRYNELRQFEHSAPEEVQDWSGQGPGKRLFETLVLFQNFPIQEAAEGGSGGLSIGGFRSRLETTYPITLLVAPRRVLAVQLHFSQQRLSAAFASRLLRHFRALLAELAEHPERPLEELAPLATAERQALSLKQADDSALPSDLPVAPDAEALLALWNEPHIARLAVPSMVLANLLADGFVPPRPLELVVSGEPPARGLVELLTEQGSTLRYRWSARHGSGWLEGTVLADREVPALAAVGIGGAESALLVDARQRPMPIGVPGKLCLRRERLEPTGWLARWLGEGVLELLGRADAGETARDHGASDLEIEALLRRQPGLLAAGVRRFGGRPVAYVLPRPGFDPNLAALRQVLRSLLPEALVPSQWVLLGEVPGDDEGWLDRDALPSPQVAGERSKLGIVAPRSPVELELVELWERLFGTLDIGIHDHFFELGGTSLLGLRLLAEVRSRFGRDLPLTSLLEGGTIAELAKTIEERRPTQVWSPLVPIQPRGTKAPLFLIHPAGGSVLQYMDLAYFLGQEQPLYGLQARGHLAGQEPIAELPVMAGLYLEALRVVQPRGPYHLGGWSMGGLVAFEIAQKLVGEGETVGLLLMLDAPAGQVAWRDYTGPVPDHAARLKQLIGGEMQITAEELRRQGEPVEQVRYLIAWAQAAGQLPANFDLAQGERYFSTLDAHAKAVTRYEPRKYPGRVTLIRARDGVGSVLADRTLGWGSLAAGGVEVLDIAATHHSFLRRPLVQTVADATTRWLASAASALTGDE